MAGEARRRGAGRERGQAGRGEVGGEEKRGPGGALLSEALFSRFKDDFTAPSFISQSFLREGQCQDSRNGCQRLCSQN